MDWETVLIWAEHVLWYMVGGWWLYFYLTILLSLTAEPEGFPWKRLLIGICLSIGYLLFVGLFLNDFRLGISRLLLALGVAAAVPAALALLGGLIGLASSLVRMEFDFDCLWEFLQGLLLWIPVGLLAVLYVGLRLIGVTVNLM